MSRSRTNLPQHVTELMSYIGKGDHDKFVEVFEDNSPFNMHHFLNRVLTQHDSDTTTPEIKTGQERIAEFLFQNYINSALNGDNSVWQEKDHDTGETINFSSSTVAGHISRCLRRTYLKESLDNIKLQEVLEFTTAERQKIMNSLSTNEYGLTPDEQIQILDHLDEQVDEILDGREATILLFEADNVFQKMLATFKTSDAAQDEIWNIRYMLANTDIPVSDKIKQLQTSLTNLAKLDPEFKKEFSQFLQKIGKSVGIVADDRPNREETGQTIQPSAPRPDIIGDENPQSLRPDLIDNEIQGTTGNPSQKTAKQIQDEEEEEARRKLAAGQNAGTNNSNHFSSSSELDQTKLAAISLKMAAILAIALGIGGPAGFILAVGFAMITNNIANGKEVSYATHLIKHKMWNHKLMRI